MAIITPHFRVSYPKVFKAEMNKLSKKMEFSVQALFPKGCDLSELKKAAKDAIIDEWGEDEKKWPANLRTPFRDQGDREKTDEKTGQKYMPPGYEKGAVYLNLRSNQKPQLLNARKEEIVDESDFYAGCWARASVNVSTYSQGGNCGVNFYLNNLQKVKEGEPLGGRTKAEHDFAPIETEDGAGPSGTSATSLFS